MSECPFCNRRAITCFCCGRPAVAESRPVSLSEERDPHVYSVPTCYPGERICERCEAGFTRNKFKPRKLRQTNPKLAKYERDLIAGRKQVYLMQVWFFDAKGRPSLGFRKPSPIEANESSPQYD